MSTCAICLDPVRETRQNTPIRCGHLFHSHCIESWKQRGNLKCPVCRRIFDGSNYKVQIVVHNLVNETSDTVSVDSIFALDVLDVMFDVHTLFDLNSLLSDFGVSMTDIDPLVLDTE